MKTIGIFFLAAGIVFSPNLLHAQSTAPDSIVQVTAENQGLSPIAREDLPLTGTFWLITSNGFSLPMPCAPLDQSIPIYALSDNVFLADGTGGLTAVNRHRAGYDTVDGVLDAQANAVVDLVNQTELTQTRSMMRTMGMAMDVPLPSGTAVPDISIPTPDYGTNLWISQWGLTNHAVTGLASNTLADVPYEIQTNTDLATTNWGSTGLFVYGSELTNWTALPFLPANQATNLFIRLKSWAGDGSGLPTWWQQQYFGTNVVDPYGNPAGDGWNNLQKFQFGWNPTNFYTPAAPQGLAATYNVNNGMATVSWLPSAGQVTGYTVADSDGHTFSVSASTTSLAEDISSHYSLGNVGTTFSVQAHYGSNNSFWGGPVAVEQNSLSGSIIAGPQGTAYLSISIFPPNTTAIRLQELDYGNLFWGDGTHFLVTNFDIPIAAFTNGLYALPNLAKLSSVLDTPPWDNYTWYAQAVESNGLGLTANVELERVFTDPEDRFQMTWLVPPFFDGRAQLKQNLIFQLRAAVADRPFQYTEIYTNANDAQFSMTYPANHAYAGYYNYWQYYTDTGAAYEIDLDVFLPFEENYFDRNFAFNSSLLDSHGRTTTGVGGLYDYHHNGGLIINGGYPTSGNHYELAAPYVFTAPTTNGAVIPPMLATNQTRWLASYALDSSENFLTEIGITNYFDTDWQTYYNTFYEIMPGAANWFGLPYLSAKVAWGNDSGSMDTLDINGRLENEDGYFYPETAQPKFQLVEYDWWPAPSPWGALTDDSDYPGMAGLALTHTNPVFIVAVGGSLQIAGYAKLAVTNSQHTGVYGYLGQYFDKAYKITDGIATTNTTGILSSYGNFFATEPGDAALVTMPDLDSGERGTGIVHCVSLNVDKNHDGIMDTSFNGPDATSQASPMEWWVNNGCSFSSGASDPFGHSENNTYQKDYNNPTIPCVRDLENFARLWICGVPALTNDNYQVSLSWANVGSGSPAINLVKALETNGEALYLTDTNIALRYASGSIGIGGTEGLKYPTIATNSPLTLPANLFTNSSTEYLLFEGAGIGSGELVLTISDSSSNVICQTGLWLDLHDVKDFYERAVITNSISGAISNWTSGIEVVQQATASALGDDTNLIVLVHGFNVATPDWLIQSDTVFKRLYWAGYRGRFMTVKWPCEPIALWTGISENTSIFNNSEIKSYKAGTALKNYLSQLRGRFPGSPLNILAHSQGNAIMGEAIEQGAPFDTYILTQGAMPSSSYDVNAATYSILTAAEALVATPEWQPMGYRGVYTNMANLPGKIVSYYNSQDSVLNIWNADQSAGKPNGYANHVLTPLASYYSYDGVNGWNNGMFFGLFSSVLVTDPQESRAMISRSRTQAVGRQDTGGVINSEIDLHAQFGFTTGTPEHSAEWTRPIQTCLPYYAQILNTIKP